MADEEFDLFGDPCRLPNGKRGRPAHRPSQEISNRVSMLLAAGWSQVRIANACHISVPTLRTHYSSILKTRPIQRDRLIAAQLMKAWEQVEAGNVGAMRLFDKLLEKNDAQLADARIRESKGAEDAETPSEKLGKKEQAQKQAEEAASAQDGLWGDLTKPGYTQ